MKPSGIPLTWQPWPSAGPCTPPAPETIAHSYLQGPVHKLILKTVVPTVSSLRGYCYTCLSNFLTRISFAYWSVARASPSWAARMYASPELKALNASSENILLQSTARRRRHFMALSTLEFVAETLSASSVGGQFGIGPTSASSLEAGSGIRLVEA